MGHTIIIIGRDEDLCSRLVCERLVAVGREVIRLTEDHLFPGLRFAWEAAAGDSHGLLGLDGQSVTFDQIEGVLARFSGIATSAADFATTDGQYLSSEWHAMVRGFIEALPCPVINRPRPELWYKTRLSPPDMMSLIPTIQLRLPATMVTTRMEDARAFFRACGNRVRYSPLTMSSNYLIETEEHLRKLDSISRLMPLYLGEVVPGETVHAFVVGRHVVFDPPLAGTGAVAEHCRHISDQLGLTFCSVELKQSTSEEWYCLGLDCMPYLFECTDEARDTVVAHLARALVSGNGRNA